MAEISCFVLLRLPPCLANATGQLFVPFGDVYLETKETKISPETCEELFTPMSPHIELGLVRFQLFKLTSLIAIV